MKLTRDSILKLHAEMTQFTYVNWGGCAVWASIVALELVKRGHDAKVVVGNSEWQVECFDETLDDVRERIQSNTLSEWSNVGVIFGHVMVEVEVDGEKQYVDSEQIAPATGEFECGGRMRKYPGYFNLKDIIGVARRQEGWNTRYDRKQTPAMRAAIKKFFNELAVA